MAFAIYGSKLQVMLVAGNFEQLYILLRDLHNSGFSLAATLEFSIIIPARNEALHIGTCLDTILMQDYAKPFEIIVVDGLSEDGTARIVETYTRKHDFIRLISNPKKITPAAFNLGIQTAQGKYLLTVGAHWKLPPNYLRMIEDAFNRHPEVDCLGGRIVRVMETETGRAIEAARATLLGGGLAERNMLEIEQIVQSSNIAYIWRRKVFDIVGVFDERLVKNQDNEFNLRSLRASLLTLYTPQVFFYYKAPDSFYKLYKQMHGYTSYFPIIQLKYRKLLYARYALPLIGLLAWLGLLVFSARGMISMVIPLILLAAYLGITLAAALRAGFSGDFPNQWWKILLAYWAIHIATSAGTLRGLLRLLNLRQTLNLWHEYENLPRQNLEK